MPMHIDVSLLDGSTPADMLTAWLTYTSGDQSFDLLLRLATAEEQRSRLKSAKSADAAFEDAAWWLSHVVDWRDLLDGEGKPVPFDVTLLRRLWDVDPYFGGWLIRECQRFANFRNAPRVA